MEALFYLETIEEEDEKEFSKMETLNPRNIPVIAITPDDSDNLIESHLHEQIEDMPVTDIEDMLEEELKGASSVINEDTDIEDFDVEDENIDQYFFDEGRTVHVNDSLDYCGFFDESFRVEGDYSKKVKSTKSQFVSEFSEPHEEDQKQLTDVEDIAGSDIDIDVVTYDDDEKVLDKLLDDHNHVIDISDKINRSPSPAATPQLSPVFSPYHSDQKTSQRKPSRLHLAPTACNYDYMTESELLVSDCEPSKKDDKKRKKLHKLKSDKRHLRKSKQESSTYCKPDHHGDSSTEDDATYKSNSPDPNLLLPETHLEVVLTDQEEILLSGNDFSKSPSSPHVLQTNDDRIDVYTDVELFESEIETYIRPKSPEPSDEENALPEPTRLMTIVKEEASGKIVDVNFPLGDAEPDGLYNPLKESLSDVEIFEADVDDLEENTDTYIGRTPTPILNNIEGGIIETAERSIVLSPKKNQHRYDFKTDTEELDLLEVTKTEKRRKNKIKPKSVAELNIELSNLAILTDTEELNLSDQDIPRRLSHPTITRPGEDDNQLTDVDDIYLSNEDEEDARRTRAYSLTPDFIHEFTGDTITTAKENDRPLSFEQKSQILAVEISIPRLVRTPDIPGAQYTDTEDVPGSADESFLENGPEIKVVEDDSFESTVHMSQSRKMDFECNEEMLHAKNAGSVRESHTDVEDVEDDEIRYIRDLRILDDSSRFCVCANTNESVCICFAKPINELSIDWQDGIGKEAETGTKKSIALKTTCSLNNVNRTCSKIITFQVASRSHSLVAQQISSKNLVVMSLFFKPRTGPCIKIPYVDFCLQIRSSGVRTEIKIHLLRNSPQSSNMSYFYIYIPKQFKIDGILDENIKPKHMKRKRPNFLTIRSLSGDLMLPGNITSYKDTSINVSELVSKFEFFSKIINNEDKEEKQEEQVVKDTTTKRKPLVDIASLKDRSISPERLKPSSIKDSPAYQAIKKTKEPEKSNSIEKVENVGRITERISIFEKLAESSEGYLKKPNSHLRRTVSFPSRKINCQGKTFYFFWWWSDKISSSNIL